MFDFREILPLKRGILFFVSATSIIFLIMIMGASFHPTHFMEEIVAKVGDNPDFLKIWVINVFRFCQSTALLLLAIWAIYEFAKNDVQLNPRNYGSLSKRESFRIISPLVVATTFYVIIQFLSMFQQEIMFSLSIAVESNLGLLFLVLLDFIDSLMSLSLMVMGVCFLITIMKSEKQRREVRHD